MTLLDQLVQRPARQEPIANPLLLERLPMVTPTPKRRRWGRGRKPTTSERAAAKVTLDEWIRARMAAFAASLRPHQTELLGPWNPPGVEPVVGQEQR